LHVPAMWATTETPAFSTSGWKGVAEAIEKGE
jgi:hypothetical protein